MFPGPQLSGVMHAGGVLRDALLRNQTAGSMRAVFAPKWRGVQRIGRHGGLAPLAAAKLFSSVAASMGSGAQANYASANAAMDEWAHQQAAKASHSRRGRR